MAGWVKRYKLRIWYFYPWIYLHALTVSPEIVCSILMKKLWVQLYYFAELRSQGNTLVCNAQIICRLTTQECKWVYRKKYGFWICVFSPIQPVCGEEGEGFHVARFSIKSLETWLGFGVKPETPSINSPVPELLLHLNSNCLPLKM